MSINVQNIAKHFGNFHALDNISLDIESGELLALLGPSGCGKTTLLRIIAGLETADAGQIVISGEDSTHVHVRERNVGFVFQHYALFRHMTVADNVAFGLRVKPRGERPSEKQIRAKVQELLKLVQLDWLADRYPAQLSGGQRQRIALARALAVEPKVLLLDEPFGALDAQVRKELRRWLRRLHDELHVTSIFVTHDQEEALEVADRVVLMNRGRIEQVGSPREVWEHPATPFVARFLGGVPLVGDGTRPLRPHELEVRRLQPGEAGNGGVVATLRRALVLDPVVWLELEPASGGHDLIEARLGTAQFQALGLREGEQVLVTPRRASSAADAALA
ncbi:sulfate/molybdate ABC transporter ATP-binding protein [Hydrogenophaga crocea]|uniref:Sulfate ABC transporter ATP-binding protein n=1 Tax=Hydrogenophaga crocea TaxID=2716225 RepID=A0A6G8ILP4_9BURK|nr:sulfate ABC transporter ATP-binding protein [Hydrogenophaga crocea]QIM53910.1 sulfate ABC transporter ATP-binding protein [Hydrogenophaga crocea]